jgi:hypothetical protein
MIREKDIEALVAEAVGVEWGKFTDLFPRLAGVLSENRLLASLQRDLAEDEKYQEAIESAIALQAGLESVRHVVKLAVGKWFERLL